LKEKKSVFLQSNFKVKETCQLTKAVLRGRQEKSNRDNDHEE
jgi:hypothetical protein